jgi:hypothetical protein
VHGAYEQAVCEGRHTSMSHSRTTASLCYSDGLAVLGCVAPQLFYRSNATQTAFKCMTNLLCRDHLFLDSLWHKLYVNDSSNYFLFCDNCIQERPCFNDVGHYFT